MDSVQQCTGNSELLFHAHCPLEQGGVLLWRYKTRLVCHLCPLQISDPEACDQMYESLLRIHTNFYKNKVRAVALATAPLCGEPAILLQHSWECLRDSSGVGAAVPVLTQGSSTPGSWCGGTESQLETLGLCQLVTLQVTSLSLSLLFLLSWEVPTPEGHHLHRGDNGGLQDHPGHRYCSVGEGRAGGKGHPDLWGAPLHPSSAPEGLPAVL